MNPIVERMFCGNIETFDKNIPNHLCFFFQALISVTVQLSFSDLTNEDVIPALNITAASGSTAFDFLQLASQQNPCYLSEYITYPSLGRYITTICCVTQNKTSDFYWFIYINNTLAPVGVDFLIPNNGDVLRFEYRFYNSTDDNHTETSQAGLFNKISDHATFIVGILMKISKIRVHA